MAGRPRLEQEAITAHSEDVMGEAADARRRAEIIEELVMHLDRHAGQIQACCAEILKQAREVERDADGIKGMEQIELRRHGFARFIHPAALLEDRRKKNAAAAATATA